MKQVTLATLIANARLFADLRGADADSGFVDSTEIARLVNLALAEFYDLLVSARGHEHYETVSTLTATPGTETISLPSDFYQLLSLHAQWGSEREEMFALDSLKDVHRLRLAGWAQNTPKRYRLRGTVIEFFPTPTAATVFDLRYVPAAPTLTNVTPGTTDVFDGVNGWDRLISLRVAIDIRALNDKSVTQLTRLYEQERARIEELASQRDAGTATRIRDASPERPEDPWPYGHGWPT